MSCPLKSQSGGSACKGADVFTGVNAAADGVGADAADSITAGAEEHEHKARVSSMASVNAIVFFIWESPFSHFFLLLFSAKIRIMGPRLCIRFFGMAWRPFTYTTFSRAMPHFLEIIMKSFKVLTAFLLAALLLSLFAGVSASALDGPTVTASAYLLADAKTGVTLCASNEHEKVYPASTTKVMTVMLAVEAVENGKASLGDLVTATDTVDDKLDQDSSSQHIQPGETMSLQDLMYCALVSSANDACNVIAQYIGGTIQNFVDMMNARAQALGCTGTHFSNPHGMPADDHYTTAADMSLIVMQAVSYSTFADIFATPYIEIGATNMSPARDLTNTDNLINKNSGDYYEYCTGGKTGSTDAAGYCLVSTAQKDDVSLVAVVMGSATAQRDGQDVPQQFSDTVTLYNWGFDNFSYREILSSAQTVKNLPVAMSGGDTISLRPETSVSILLANDDDISTFQQNFTIYDDNLTAPIEAGTVLGEVSVSRDGVVYGTSRLLAATSVSLSKTEYLQGQISKTWHNPKVQIVFWVLVVLLALYAAYLINYYVKRYRYRQSVRMARQLRQQQRERMQGPLPPGYGYNGEEGDGAFDSQWSQKVPQMAQGARGAAAQPAKNRGTRVPQDTLNRDTLGQSAGSPDGQGRQHQDSEDSHQFFEHFFDQDR